MSLSSLLLLLCTAILAMYGGMRLLRVCEKANEVEWGNPWLNRLDGFNRLFCRYYHRLDAEPLQLPAQGPALVVANHISGLDSLLMLAASRRRLHFMMAREEFERFGMRWLFRAVGCIPVDRERRPERALREAINALQAGHVIAMFPHGRMRLDHEPPARLKGGVVVLARRSGCPVYPLRISGVRAQGKVITPVFIRARARLRTYPPLICHGDGPGADCLETLADILEGRRG